MKISVTVKPKSREEGVEKIGEHEYRVKVSEAPESGKANRAVVKLLADYFNTSSSRIVIVSGYTSRKKVVEIE